MNRKMLTQMAVGAVIAALCMYFLLRNTDIGELWAALRQAKYIWLIPVLALYVVSLAFRTWRWKYLLIGVKPLSFGALWTPVAFGFLGNAVLPARMGEVIRVVMLSRQQSMAFSTVLASLVMDRMFDMIAAVIIGITAFAILPIDAGAFERFGGALGEFTDQAITIDTVRRTVGVTMGGALVLGLAMLGLLYYQRARAERIFRVLLFFLPERPRERLIGLLERFTDGLHVFRSGRHVLYCLLCTAGTWVPILLTFLALFRAFDFQAQLPLHAPFIMVACASVAVMIPTPGYFGPYQVFMAIALALCSSTLVEEAGAAVEAFAMVAWLGSFLPPVVIGILALMLGRVDLATLREDVSAGAHAQEDHASASPPAGAPH